MESLVSVIIPVFNAEKSIDRCLHSLLKQNYNNLEIIIVDDGSTDKTLKLCNSFSKNDKRIKVYHIENEGVSHARNYGVSMAKGYWIMFIDADDYILENAVETVVKIASLNKVDICCWNGFYSQNGELKKMGAFFPTKKIYDKNEIINLMYGLYCENTKEYYGDFFRAVWGKLFRRELIEKNLIAFQSGIRIGEDALFMLDCLNNAKRVLMTDLYLYCYECTNISVTGKYKENFEQYQIEEALAMKEKFLKYNLNCEKLLTEFWHKAEKDYIKNELKQENNVLTIAGKVDKWFNKDSQIMRYMRKNDIQDGIKAKVRVYLIRFRLKFMVAVIDTIIIKRKCKKLGEIR